jgi:hypothetical protein
MILRTKDLIELAIKRGQLPKFLYRYRPCNDFTFEELSQGYLWYSNVEAYNDPFEGILRFETDSTLEELYNYLINADHQGKLTESRAMELAKHYHTRPKELQERFSVVKEVTQKRLGICSLTTNPDNLLMWSHYSSGHTGICIKYSTVKLIEPGVTPVIVEYTDDYPTFNYIKEWEDKLKLASESFQKKSPDWAYEEEHRLVTLDRLGKIGLKRAAMIEIILGARTSKENAEQIEKSLSNNIYQKPIIKKAKLMKTKFGIELE